jgi:2-oxoglutarate dehydrogenase E1 component
MTETNLSTLSLEYLERLYAEYVEHPTQVPPEWRRYFDELGAGNGQPTRVRLFPSIRPASIFHPPADGAAARAREDLQTANRQERVDQLIREYRVRGRQVVLAGRGGGPDPAPGPRH